MGKHELALNCFESVHRANPQHLDSLFHKGIELAELERHEKAIEVFDKILDKHKGNVNVVYAKARSKAALNEVNEAFDLLNVAIKQSKTIKLWARKEKVFQKFYEDPEFQRMVK
jgi:tetratricopeptide (TPR) repeat protein